MYWTGTYCPSTPYTAPGKRLWLTCKAQIRFVVRAEREERKQEKAWEHFHHATLDENSFTNCRVQIKHRSYLSPMGQHDDHTAIILGMVNLRQSWQLMFNLLKCWNVCFKTISSKGVHIVCRHTIKDLLLTFCLRFVLTSTIKFNALNLLSSFRQSMLDPLRLLSWLWGSKSTLFMMRQCPHGLASIL